MRYGVVTSEKLKSLFHSGRLLTYQKNETILRAGEVPRGVYLIESGIVKIYSLSQRGNEHVHHFFSDGDFFPVIWTFRDTIRSMYYEALTPTKVWVVDRQAFRDFVSKNPEAMADLMEILIDRYNLYSGRIDNLLHSDARQRAAYRILSLANRFGEQADDGLVINASITHEDMAHSINITRETFGRTIGRLQERGIISYDADHHIIIKDLSALSHIIGEDETNAMWPGLRDLTE